MLEKNPPFVAFKIFQHAAAKVAPPSMRSVLKPMGRRPGGARPWCMISALRSSQLQPEIKSSLRGASGKGAAFILQLDPLKSIPNSTIGSKDIVYYIA